MQIKAGFSLEDITVERIARLAKATRHDKSAIVDMAVELLATQEEFSHIPQPTAPRKPTLADIPVRKGAATA